MSLTGSFLMRADNAGSVDYKTSSHEGADIESFLNREQERYHVQLDRYANLMRLIDGQAVRRGLRTFRY